MRKIVVSGNCQMGVIVACLRLIFPNDEVTALPYVSLPQDDKLNEYQSALNNADLWLVISKEWAINLLGKIKFDIDKIISFPNLEFRGFHPDQSYILEPNSNDVSPIYYSSVVVGAYKMDLSPEIAASCFNSLVFEKLGYHDNWNNSISALKWRFAQSDMKSEYVDYIRFCQRRWVFMHTLNHPHVECIVWLAKLIAIKIGASLSILNQEIILPDLLSVLVWPIYPSIASTLSINGSFTFIWSNKALSLIEFINMNYTQLDSKYKDKSKILAAPYYIELNLVEKSIYEYMKG